MGWDILPNRGFILERLYPHQEHERSGLSQLGGAPLFPIHYPWPRYTQDLYNPQYDRPERPAGQPFHFVAQIDLECLTHDKSTVNLPRKGMLYFFADLSLEAVLNETASCRVVYFKGPRDVLRATPAPADTVTYIGSHYADGQTSKIIQQHKDKPVELPYWPLRLTALETLPREDPFEVDGGRDLSEAEEAFMAALETAFPEPAKPTATDFPDEGFPYNNGMAQIFLRKLKEELTSSNSEMQLQELLGQLVAEEKSTETASRLNAHAKMFITACDIDILIKRLDQNPPFSLLKNTTHGFIRNICQEILTQNQKWQSKIDAAKLFACTQGLYYLYALDRAETIKTCASALETLSRFDRPYPAQSQTDSAIGYHHQFFGHPSMPQDTCRHEREERPPQHLFQLQGDNALCWNPYATLYFWLDLADLQAHDFPRTQIELMGC